MHFSKSVLWGWRNQCDRMWVWPWVVPSLCAKWNLKLLGQGNGGVGGWVTMAKKFRNSGFVIIWSQASDLASLASWFSSMKWYCWPRDFPRPFWFMIYMFCKYVHNFLSSLRIHVGIVENPLCNLVQSSFVMLTMGLQVLARENDCGLLLSGFYSESFSQGS